MESRKGAEWESPLVARLGLVPGVLWQEAKDQLSHTSALVYPNCGALVCDSSQCDARRSAPHCFTSNQHAIFIFFSLPKPSPMALSWELSHMSALVYPTCGALTYA